MMEDTFMNVVSATRFFAGVKCCQSCVEVDTTVTTTSKKGLNKVLAGNH